MKVQLCGLQAITEEVYKLLEDQCQLRRVYIPVGLWLLTHTGVFRRDCATSCGLTVNLWIIFLLFL